MSDALDELFWRSEILQVLFWMQGEGLAQEVSPEEVARFMAVEEEVVAQHMALLVVADLLQEHQGRYRLSVQGKAEGARSFHDDFAELTRLAHGECAADCWCKDPAHAGQPCPAHGKAHQHA